MKSLALLSIIIFLLILSTSLSPSSSAIPTRDRLHSRPFNKIYAFGDSFTDTGNTKSITGPTGFGHVSNSPYGITFFHRPTNRYCDGRLVIDFVAETLSLPYLQPYQIMKAKTSSNGVNFAVAGSTAINHEFFVRNNLSLDITPQSIQTQLLWFSKSLEREGICRERELDCGGKFDDVLFWVGEIGVNDYAYTLGSSISGDTIRKLGVASVTGFLQALLKKGAKYVVVQGLPPSGCLPLAMSLAPENDRDGIGCVKSVNEQTFAHNLALQTKLQELRTKYPHSIIAYADYWNAYHTVMRNPRENGFKEAFRACCGSGEPYNFDMFTVCGMASVNACTNPSEYVNWDGVHLTEAMYKVLFDMFVKGNFMKPSFSFLLEKK